MIHSSIPDQIFPIFSYRFQYHLGYFQISPIISSHHLGLVEVQLRELGAHSQGCNVARHLSTGEAQLRELGAHSQGRQAGRQAGRLHRRQVGRQAGRQVGR